MVGEEAGIAGAVRGRMEPGSAGWKRYVALCMDALTATSAAKLTPGVVEPPLSSTLPWAQVISPPVAETFGVARSSVTLALAELLQPLGAVTVKV